MMRLGVVLVLVASPAVAQQIAVPSGQAVEFVEVLADDSGDTIRFRFLAPAIARDGGSVGNLVALADMEALCRDVAVPWLAQQGESVAQIVISLADQPVTFGVSTPQATQFFETYRHENGRCIWEEF